MDSDIRELHEKVYIFMKVRMSEEAASMGIPVACVPFILEIGKNPGQSVTDVANRTFVNKSTVSRNVRMLSEMGIVEQIGEERSRNQLFLTERGMEVFSKLKWFGRSIHKQLFSDVTDEEYAAFIQCFRKMAASVDSYGSKDPSDQ